MAEAKTKKTEDTPEPEKGTIRVRGAVKPNADGGAVVVLFERDSQHPGGEAYIAGQDEAEVYPTPKVVSLLRDAKLVEV